MAAAASLHSLQFVQQQEHFGDLAANERFIAT